jgi:hypothetical protein
MNGPLLQRPPAGSKRTARLAPRSLPQPLSPSEMGRKEKTMSWLKKLIERDRKAETKSEPKVETRPEALRIQELETRIAPNAVWGE